MRTMSPEELAREKVLVHAVEAERPMLAPLLEALRTFHMVGDAHPRVVETQGLHPENAAHAPRGTACALVLDGWVRRYGPTQLGLGTLGQVQLAVEFFVKAWRLRDDAEAAARAEREAAELAVFEAQCVIRRRRPAESYCGGAKDERDAPDARECYVRRLGPLKCGMVGLPRRRATVFRNQAEARAFGERFLSPLAGKITAFHGDMAWDDFFEVVHADEVPGSWAFPWVEGMWPVGRTW